MNEILNNTLIASGVSITFIVCFLLFFEIRVVLSNPALITVLRMSLAIFMVVSSVGLILKLIMPW